MYSMADSEKAPIAAWRRQPGVACQACQQPAASPASLYVMKRRDGVSAAGGKTAHCNDKPMKANFWRNEKAKSGMAKRHRLYNKI